MITILVCGGRHYANRAEVFRVLDEMQAAAGSEDIEIVHGGATGADTFAGEWARDHENEEHIFRAKWKRFGNYGGPKRNRVMLERGLPDIVIAFPGGPGTADMCDRVARCEFPAFDKPFRNGDAFVYVREGLE